ncbi:substrate-binding domain-containing protein [Prosthecomicrobium pneumaticum]|uniref:Simple sugar transport system substrate-binding protein n=1 Tax=Prosthecomicrobium pneumaticum TaxID=81895 RepID=A0A7W9CTE4_9HYPH|nr:substrate-binding domain-containing protein [Prosthecomicrobium pneumaticum]MBB5751206.1 simple sugar transport system substrate-binding protein [Prosthecomicrobium pneumaticum]
MKSVLKTMALCASVSVVATFAHAQSGVLEKAVGGYTFGDAAKEAEGTKNFHSADGKLTFAVITHTAGNGFFDPTYVGAKVAADAFGINLIMLGSEAPVDDIPREIEILNQVINDPTIDGIVMTTPQSGAYDDIVNKAFANGIPVATTNSFDPALAHRNQISHTGQSSAAAAVGGEALAKCLLDKGVEGGSIILPSTTTLGNVEVNRRVTAAFEAIVKTLNDAGKLANFKVDAGPENIGVDVNKDDIVNSIVSLIESRGDVVGAFAANAFVTPALGDAIAQLGMNGKVCAFGFDLGPKQQELIKSDALTGSLGQQPFLQGFWPVAQLYLEIDRGVQAADLDTKAQLVTKENVDKVGKRFEN